MVRYIKVKAECILPVPVEVRDDLDAVAEAGLMALRELIAEHITTAVPGTVAGSWLSMPQGWQPRRPKSKSNVVMEEQLIPGVSHALVSDEEGERVVFIDERAEVPHPWDQGLMIFPEDHPLWAVEQPYFRAYREGGDPRIMASFASQLKQLEEGKSDDDN